MVSQRETIVSLWETMVANIAVAFGYVRDVRKKIRATIKKK